MIIGVIIITLLVIFVIGILILSLLDEEDRARQLDQRVQSAEQQIAEIGQRTRAAIIAEARRRQEQGQP